jgi:RNA polymerase sigma-70 factor (ECF subfamily)
MASKESTRVLARGADAHALEDLLVRTAAGDEAAFRTLYDRSAGRLFAVCMRIARHRRMAEDMLQDTYVHIFRRAREFDPARGSALAWMIAIARSQAMDLMRLLKREDRPPDELTLEAAEPGALAGIEAKFELSALGRCLGELADAERHAIILAYRDGLNYDQLSVLLGVSLETVKEQVGRGLKRLRDCLEPP